MGILHKIRMMVAATVHRQGRYLRGQIYELVVTLMIIGVAMILFVTGLIAGGIALYLALRHVVNPAGAMGIITALLLGMAVILGLLGHQLQRLGINSREEHHDHDGHDPQQHAWQDRPSASPAVTPSSKSGSKAGHPFHEMEERLKKPLKLVKHYPMASIGVALGLGVVLGRSKSARSTMKTAAKVGGKMLLDHYLKDR